MGRIIIFLESYLVRALIVVASISIPVYNIMQQKTSFNCYSVVPGFAECRFFGVHLMEISGIGGYIY
jgi:hypothetical protein